MIISERVGGQLVQHNAELHSIEADYDVIVAGLGTAGAIAAIAAAEQGLKVLGIERMSAMGGTGTIGAVIGYYFGNKGGLFEEIDEEVQRLAKLADYTKAAGVSADLKKIALEQRMEAAGVTIHYNATVIGVYMQDRTVKGVRWIGEDGISSAKSRIVIDCTGEAELSMMAGADYRKGRESDGKMQPFSNAIVWIENDAVKTFYTDSGYVDCEDGDSLSKEVIQSACCWTHQPDIFTEAPKFAKLAPLLGVREGRFIVGEQNVSFRDFINGTFTEEPLFYAYSNLDNHGKDVAFESELQQDWIVGASLWGLNFSVPIPLGALIPKGLDGLLVAGRSLAIDHDLAACVRMKRDMQKCGEAAAIVALLAIRHEVPLHKVPYDELKGLLMATGCLQEANHVGMRYGVPTKDDHEAVRGWLTDEQNIRSGLASDKPGIAIWSARNKGEQIRPLLQKWITLGEEPNLQRHSAFALALLGDRSAIPILRMIVQERDSFFPKTSRKYNQARGYAAIYLLGKLQDEGIVLELLNILHSREQFANVSTDAEFINHDDEYFFQYFTFSIAALFRIADRHSIHRALVEREIRKIVDDPDFSLYITFKPSKDVLYNMAETIRNMAREQFKRWEHTR
ncbi:FAD-dependent oxidoreductase [Paenibacillus sp. GCM10027626]|uniref:FAD-dependent oxidoreductase n=1 Tax=Paenibacillus sp. GCM10027626 TaxID=3273411 RepID=UPI0036256707